MKRKLHAGTTSVMMPIFVFDSTSTSGAGLSGLTNATSGLVFEYRRQGQSSWTTITKASATLGTYTSGGIVADGSLGGAYEIGVPDAALASGARWCALRLSGATSMVPVLIEVELDAVDYQDGVHFGLTSLPNAAVNTANGLITIGTSTGQLNPNGAGTLPLDATNASLLTDTDTIVNAMLTVVAAISDDTTQILIYTAPASILGAVTGGSVPLAVGADGSVNVSAASIASIQSGLATASALAGVANQAAKIGTDGANTPAAQAAYAAISSNLDAAVSTRATATALASVATATAAISNTLGTPAGASVSADIASIASGSVGVTGTATAGGNTTITLANGTVANTYSGQVIQIKSGTGAHQARTIVSGSGAVATVDRAWNTNPDATSVYAITGQIPGTIVNVTVTNS